MIYPEICGDYYSKNWDAEEYESQFEILLDETSYSAAKEEGFVRLSSIEKVQQFFKGCVGLTDYSQTERIQAAALKFLYFGEAHGFLDTNQLNRLQRKINLNLGPQDPAFNQIFREIQDYRHRNIPLSEHLNHLRVIVLDYHKRHASSLRPCLWSRLHTYPFINSSQLILFGETPLQLSQQALAQKKPSPSLALHYLQNAFALKNSSPEFQEKIVIQLKWLENVYKQHPDLMGREHHIQKLWIGLAQTAFEHGRRKEAIDYLARALKVAPLLEVGKEEIGTLYLMHQEYALALPFLPALKEIYAHDPQMLTKIGHAYWHEKRFAEAISLYQTTINAYKEAKHHLTPDDQKQIAFLHDTVGAAYLTGLMGQNQDNLAKAIQNFTAAVMSASTKDYQKHLFHAYFQQWTISPRTFATTYGSDFLNILNILDSDLKKECKDTITTILLDSSEQFFLVHNNQKAHTCLKKMLSLFEDQVDLRIKAVDLAIRFNDWKPLEAKFADWEKENYANPYLREKIGDAFWNEHKDKALKVYQEALRLFSQRLAICPEEEKTHCQAHIADLQAKIGQEQLNIQPGFFKGVPFEQAIERLGEAAALKAEYSPLLFKANLEAAKNESQRSFLLRDSNKIMGYYQQAFQASHENGSYLTELMQLYMGAKRLKEAIALFVDIQGQTWAQEFILPPEGFSKLAQILLDNKELKLALVCLKKAHQLMPENGKYKQEYFQQSLNLAKQEFDQARKEEKGSLRVNRLKEIAASLITCWEEGFQKAEKLKPVFQEMLAKIFHARAGSYLPQCLLPQPKSGYEGRNDEISAHKIQQSKWIQFTLQLYEKGLSYHPEAAYLHFDKGLLLDWLADLPEALEAYKLAVKYNPRNPFYHKRLALTYGAYYDERKCEEHNRIASKNAPQQFAEDYPLWYDEHMCKVKTREINPHTYPI